MSPAARRPLFGSLRHPISPVLYVCSQSADSRSEQSTIYICSGGGSDSIPLGFSGSKSTARAYESARPLGRINVMANRIRLLRDAYKAIEEPNEGTKAG